jgi:hypothetical protein
LAHVHDLSPVAFAQALEGVARQRPDHVWLVGSQRAFDALSTNVRALCAVSALGFTRLVSEAAPTTMFPFCGTNALRSAIASAEPGDIVLVLGDVEYDTVGAEDAVDLLRQVYADYAFSRSDVHEVVQFGEPLDEEEIIVEVA